MPRSAAFIFSNGEKFRLAPRRYLHWVFEAKKALVCPCSTYGDVSKVIVQAYGADEIGVRVWSKRLD